MNRAKHSKQDPLSEEQQRLNKLALKKTFKRLLQYGFFRVLTILITIGLGLYLTLVIVNLGGFVDDIFEAQISEMIAGMGLAGEFDDIPPDERDAYIAELKWQMEEARGLHEPLAIRTARWWWQGITFQWGESERIVTLDHHSNSVADIIFERLPYTLMVVGAGNVILFFTSLGVAMRLSTNQNKFIDRLLVSLTPISSAPSWIHGVILLAIFALELRILPFKGMFEGTVPDDPVQYALILLEHMVLPVAAVILSAFFQGVYTWRTFFLVHSGEDYVELAKAKGLPARWVRRRYLLLPTLPSIITSFTLLLIGFWEAAIPLEILFRWTGIGALFYSAVGYFDRPVIVAMVVMFAYLLGVSVIILDIVYALIDPRVRIGKNGASRKTRAVHKRRLTDIFKQKKAHPDLSASRTLFDETLEVEEGAPVIPTKAQRSGPLVQIFGTVKKQILKYPMAVVGLFLVLFLVFISIYTVITVPYSEAVEYWRSGGMLLAPKLARPVWTNYFRQEKWPESIFFDSAQETDDVESSKERVEISDDITDIRMTFDFTFTADIFPEDLEMYIQSTYVEKHPFITLLMITPDGREIEVDNFSAPDGKGYMLNYDGLGIVKPGELPPVKQVFGDPDNDLQTPMKGEYQLQVLAMVFEEDADVDVQGVIHGKVYGLFGTDNQRRDLTIAMMWGTPVALTFGIVGAIVTTLTTILIAAASAWYGGFLDEILQRITELNIILPALPIVILVYMLYSKSIWVILGVMILLNIFGSSLKEYRAMFLQFKEAPYIEAAMAYGASNWRIVRKYLLPRIVQVMVPQLVIAVPSFVFLEATLAFLGVKAPYLPTWGKVVNEALSKGAYWGHYFWVLEPIVLVLITGLAFAMVGFALDSILNPRLRD